MFIIWLESKSQLLEIQRKNNWFVCIWMWNNTSIAITSVETIINDNQMGLKIRQYLIKITF